LLIQRIEKRSLKKGGYPRFLLFLTPAIFTPSSQTLTVLNNNLFAERVESEASRTGTEATKVKE